MLVIIVNASKTYYIFLLPFKVWINKNGKIFFYYIKLLMQT